jgi:Iap family predicted aminopeptidase
MIGDLVSKVLEMSAPPSDEIELTIIEGVKIKFRILVDMEERMKVEEEVIRWAKDFAKSVERGTVLDVWKEVATDNLAILAQVKMLAMLSLTDDFKSELAWMTIAKRAAPVFAGTVTALDQAAANKASDYAVFLEGKGSLKETPITPKSAE